MRAPHLVIHYHRLHHDYASWQLCLSQSPPHSTYSLHQHGKPARTSFGLAFRTPLQWLSDSFTVLPFHHPSTYDHPARPVIIPQRDFDLHFFIIEADPNVYTDLRAVQNRFLPVSVPHAPASTWLIAITQSALKQDIFPPSLQHRTAPPFFLLDLSYFSDNQIYLTAVTSHHDALCIQAPASTHATLTLPTDHQHVALIQGKLHSFETNPLHMLLAQQADQYVSLSKLEQIQPIQVPSPSYEYAQKSTILRVYVKRLHNDTSQVMLSAVSPDGPSPHVLREKNDYQYAPVFIIDTSRVTTLRLTPLIAEKPEMTYVWSESQGMHITLAETFPQPLTAVQTNRTIFYHRFGDFSDWNDWELHIWSEANDKYPSFREMLKPERPPRDGVILFDSGNMLFPKGAVVYAEPVRMSMFPGRILLNEYGEEYQGEPYRDSSLRDVVRQWVCGEESPVMHFLQGDTQVREAPPMIADMHRKRKFRLRYRRYMPNDYEDWDLWTWDEKDPNTSKIAIEPEPGSQTRAWVDFAIDRSLYGGGSCICVVPRKGGDTWKERDQPVRKFTETFFENTKVELEADDRQSASPAAAITSEDIPTFLILQGSSLILRELNDVTSMLDAYVDVDNSIVISAPVPFGWASPPKRGYALPGSAAKVRLCEESASKVLPAEYSIEDCAGTALPFRKVQQVSHTQSRLVFDRSVAHFHEDFPVENVLVSVPGFNTVALHWKVQEDWDKYLYEGNLGWEYTPEQCSFRCFAPTADVVSVILYESPTGSKGRKVHKMRKIPQGCWKAIVNDDLKGMYYKLLAEGENKRLFPGVEVIDPYSRCNTGHTGRGLIFGNESTEIHPRVNIPPSEAIIYELHIRDITIDKDSGISRRGKFSGLVERGTSMENRWKTDQKEPLTPWRQEDLPRTDSRMQNLDKLSTGLDHIVQMGVNTIQILPIQDFDNDETDDSSYRWGYMPVHFNSPDGWYASSTTSVARVTEFKRLVDAIHKAGLKVIMDVVYNHTAEDSNEFNLDARFSFNGLAPRYYYRTCGNTPVAHTGDSTCARRRSDEARCGECYSNGSGCGNEFRSESPMGRKFIIDSLKYWVNEYQVDGFRFDLLGLIDVDTLQIAAAELRKIDPNIMMYGEPWAGGLSPIKLTEKGAQRSKGFGMFNNTFRDAIRGSPFGVEETFVMDGGRLGEVKGGIIGSIHSFCDNPLETINYVECHDNYTLWDHMRFYIRSRTDDIKISEVDMRRMDRLAAVIIFTSQGIPFMQAGQEMCRTKFDVENSYESPDEINMIRWKTKVSEWNTVLYYRGLILLRRRHPEIFCKTTAEEIHDSILFYEDLGLTVPDRCIAYRVCGNQEKLYSRLRHEDPNAEEEAILEESLRWTAVVVLLNPTPNEVEFALPEQSTDGAWVQIVDSTSAGTRPVRSATIGTVAVQGRSAALLRRASEKEERDFQLLRRLDAVTDSFCCFHGDNPLSRYAVGLDKCMGEQEQREYEDLKMKRMEFERRRKLNSVKSR